MLQHYFFFNSAAYRRAMRNGSVSIVGLVAEMLQTAKKSIHTYPVSANKEVASFFFFVLSAYRTFRCE